MSDADYETLLAPDVPVESAGVCRVADDRAYYVARLQQKTEGGYEKKYRKLIESRGLLIEASAGSPHSPSGVRSYFTYVLRPTSVRPFALRYRQLFDGSGWDQREALYKSYPSPVQVEGRLLVVRLGRKAFEPWQESVLLPEKDMFEAPELPFGRFPGAVLTGLWPEGDFNLRDDASVSRTYVVRGAALDDVLAHYSRAVSRYGTPRVETGRQIRWSSKPAVGMVEFGRVEEGHVLVIPGRFSLQDVQGRVPELLRDYPEDVTCFLVGLTFSSVEAASAYWTPEDQERRRQLLTTPKKEN